jgi:aryl-alcohol dehydrogenase-like predicted oxidoreductase
VAVVCSSPLGRGLLTGTFTTPESATGEGDFRGAVLPRFSKENIEANIKLVDEFKTLADKKGCTLAQLSLAWLLKQGDDIFPIPGTKQIKYLEQNLEAFNVHLTDEEEAEIRKFVEDMESRVAGDKTVEAAKVLDFSVTKQPES